jgi:hypothetical protein
MLNGKYLNPATAFRNLPQGDPIPASELDTFRTQRDAAFRQLASRSSSSAATEPVGSR